MKVNLFSFNLIKKTTLYWLSIFSFSSALIPFFNFNWKINICILIVLVIFLLPIHLLLWAKASKLKSIKLNINNSDLVIKWKNEWV